MPILLRVTAVEDFSQRFDSHPAKHYIIAGMLDDLRKKSLPTGLRRIKRIIVFVIGFTVLVIGVALLALPGPGLLVLAGGLAILGLEFPTARSWLRKARHLLHELANRRDSRADKK